jgi:hypothetical protein
MSFAFWASSVSSSNNSSSGQVTIGAWWIPIYTAQEFYDFATKTDSLATDKYYLATDIDFTGFNWTYNATNNSVTFRGELNGNQKTLSNLTITNTTTTYNYHGIFPRISGARIHDLTLYNIQLVTNPSSGTAQRAGLISGNAYGGTNLIQNLKVLNSGTQGASANGVGGLIGEISGASTIVTFSRIKLNNMKVFSRSAYVGGLVGRVNTSGATVNMADIDFKGDVYSNSTNTTTGSIAGGLIGQTNAGTYANIERAIVDVTFQNTLVTAVNYLAYGTRYLGGFIGYNLSASANIQISYSFMTGSLYTRTNDATYVRNVGTVTGRLGNNATLNNVYHSYVLYRTTTGSSYTETNQLGQMATVVSQTEMPTEAWWNSAYSIFSGINNYWSQEAGTGRLYLDGTLNIANIGVPISTKEEFYALATNTSSLPTDTYYLADDIDFTGFTWNYDASNNSTIFRGTLNGNNKTISNLTITNTSTTYLYLGIFPRMDGGTVSDLTLDNVQLVTSLSGTTQRAGLIAGNVYNGKVNTIKNITIINSGVQGNSTNGVGGLVGYVQTNLTVLNIENIKATNFKVFNRTAYVGGLVGRLANTSTVNISDVDLQGEVYAHTSSGYSGGLIGYTPSGTFATINRAIVEVVFINTLVTNATYYNRYSDRYIGGFIGYNQAATASININHSFFTGSLFNQTNTYRNAVGTAVGRLGTVVTLSDTYHSNVSYRNASGVLVYGQTGQAGQMATLVDAYNMPTLTWWNTFYNNYYSPANSLWAQDGTGRPYLIR